MSDAALLAAEGISKSFDQTLALDGVDLKLDPGEVHALLGENGAGKTTLANVLAGIYRPDAGVIRTPGGVVSAQSPREAIAAGVGMVHQHFRLAEALTGAENLHLGWSDTPRFAGPRLLAERTDRICEEYGLKVDARLPVWQMSVGERQRLEILRVLVRGARVLMLDEPTAVLTPTEVDGLFDALRKLAAAGRSVLFVSHKLNEVLEISDRITVLRGGRVEATRSAASTTAAELARLMTGHETPPGAPRGARPGDAAVLEVEGVSVRGSHGRRALAGVSFAVQEGEILGIAGVSGNGQTELAEVVTGLRTPEEGSVSVDGEQLGGASPRRFAAAGVGYIPADRMATALAGSCSVLENAIVRDYDRPPLARYGMIDRGAARRFTAELVAEAGVRGADDIGAPVSILSGGNQQKLVAHREARMARRLLVACLPTRGLDVAAAHAIRNKLLERRGAGAGVLLISEDLDELLELSDRVLVLYEGAIAGEFSAGGADRDRIGIAMGGGLRPAGAPAAA
ncbi:MAG: ral nucleoside transport system ATP-binding protein [Thermoleophilaceae bacterium]|jgi:simple sugar transport system ATP-binding protein|nr:ral nucleoside transport system ATP-binding protein [Thermoleophilaceae bacterium]